MSRSANRYAPFLIFLLLLLCAGCGQDANAPKAENGRITLNAQNSETVVPLIGEWAFYWNRALTPDDFRGPNPPKPDGFLKQPGGWKGYQIAGHALGAYGIATLRLIVDPGPVRQELGLRLPVISKSYHLWIDGRLVSSRGIVGSDPGKEGGTPSHSFIAVSAEGHPIELLLQISNHRLQTCGPRGSIFIGPARLVELQSLASMRLAIFLTGGLTVMAFYHFAIFAFRRANRSSLYFGLFVLLWGLIALIQNDENLWVVLLSDDNVDSLLYRAQWFLLFVSLPLIYAFFQSLYPQDMPASLLKIISVVAVPLCFVALFATTRVMAEISLPVYIYIGALVFFIAYRVVVATWKNRSGALYTLAGFVFLGAAAINDMLSDTDVLPTHFLMPVGILTFALLQTLYLAHRSARNLAEIQNLSAELDAKNASLELKVAETERLSRQIVRVSEAERSRISQDLHDGICQQLTAARLRFSVLKKKMLQAPPDKAETEELSTLLEGAVNQAYDLSLGLWPVDTGTGHLATSFEELCRRIARSNGLDVVFRSNLPLCPRQPPEVTRQLYRIAQEALTNVAKHADASHVNVAVFCSQRDGIRLIVEDDGIGRTRKSPSTDGRGFGTHIMNHRAVVIGGMLSIEDRPGGGTIVSCSVPCPGSNADCPLAAEQHNA